MLAFLLMTFSLPDAPRPLVLQEGGFCTGIAWISVQSSEGLTNEVGPDFRVYRFASDSGWWGIYSGNAAQVSHGKKRLLFKRDGVSVNGVTVDGRFRGYLAVNDDGWQNHFFGSPFDGGPEDIRFFDSVDFGPAGKSKCKKYPPQ